MKHLIVLTLLPLLLSCVNAPPVVPTVTPAQVATLGADLKAIGLTPGQYVNDGMLLNMWACDAYLLGEAQLNGNFGVAAQGTTLGTALATGILGVTGAGAPAVALAGISGGGLASGLGILASNTGIPYSAATAQKVQEAMAAYAQAVWVSPPPTLAHAAMLVEQQRYLCTPPGITWLAGTSIATAQIGTASSNHAMALGPATPSFGLPVITINGAH